MDQLSMFLLGEAEGVDLNLILNVVDDLAQPLKIGNKIRRKVRRNENYVQVVVPQYLDDQFKEHFRMSRGTFDDLVNVIGQTVVWRLSNPESFLATGARFGIAPSSGHYVFKEFITVLANLLPQYIKWPDVRSYSDISKASF
ncbi:hypothetical protein NQ314_020261 [Rhamnusium bicolor]|uniref:Uncharacterized protein n=1 Tax=Rhamnusium bicolor TaxID=1586634 RepID=A0AAV8WM07_9CUCU|nr:hypothetical protein NQ314_020261 [Rhamnusium bicolor]